MAIVPISRTNHSDKGWKKFENLNFAQNISMIPVTALEFPSVALNMPIVLIKVQADYFFAAVMGIENDRNLYISNDGRWLGNYVPSYIRGYPFSLQTSKDGKSVLCIQEEFILPLDQSNIQPFFNSTGDISDKLRPLMDFLEKKELDKRRTDRFSKLLQKLELIEPGQATINLSSGKKNMEGYHKINEDALNQLEDQKFLEIRSTGYLFACYLHLLSLSHWRNLGGLYEGRRSSEQVMKKLGDEIFNLSSEDTVNLDGF